MNFLFSSDRRSNTQGDSYVGISCPSWRNLVGHLLDCRRRGISAETAPPGVSDGVITVRSAYPVGETVDRLKHAVAEKGITYFETIDQNKLGAQAGISVRPSMLLVFGNPALGVQFLGGNPLAGLDWPVRLVVMEDAKGQVWRAYSDFALIARRHHITTRDEAFGKATEVIASINDSIRAK